MTAVWIVLGVAALALLWAVLEGLHSRRTRQAIRLEGKVLYQDEGLKSELLVSEELGLKGKPDLLLKQKGFIIPVDKKPGRRRSRPYASQTMQLAAYCALVEAVHGVRPPHGIIRYNDGDTEVPFTPQLEARLSTVLERMQSIKRGAEAHRSHASPGKCRSCGFNAVCDERLAG